MSHGPFRTTTDHESGSEQRYIVGTRERKKVELFDFHPSENRLFPVRPRVALLLVLLPAESLDAKAL